MDAAQLALLRLYIADPAGTGEFLHTQDLEVLFSENDEDLAATAAAAWRVKAGDVAGWYAANIDGSFLSRQQVWEHCMTMADHYSAKSGASLVNVAMDSSFDTSDDEPEF